MKKTILSPFRALARAFYRSLGFYPLKKYGERYKLDPYHIWLWRRIGRDGWEPETFEILSRYLEPDSVYCDLGAWIGTTSILCAATRCKHIYCFEPDVEAFRYLLWNIKLNNVSNITPFNFALSEKTELSRMAPFHGTPGDSTSSLIHKEASVNGEQVLTVSWLNFVDWAAVDQVDFMKIDIEGGEFDFLPSIKWYLDQNKPTIYLSTHAPYLQSAEREAAMQKISDALSGYRICRDSNLVEVGFDVLTAPDSLSGFRSFVFEP